MLNITVVRSETKYADLENTIHFSFHRPSAWIPLQYERDQCGMGYAGWLLGAVSIYCNVNFVMDLRQRGNSMSSYSGFISAALREFRPVSIKKVGELPRRRDEDFRKGGMLTLLSMDVSSALMSHLQSC